MNDKYGISAALNKMVSGWVGKPVKFVGHAIGGWPLIVFEDGTHVGDFTDQKAVAQEYPHLPLEELTKACTVLWEFAERVDELQEIRLQRSEEIASEEAEKAQARL